jgi:hypothetical protein
MLDGDPGAGKSYVSLAIAATVSLGAPWPDGADLDGQTKIVGNLNPEPGNVLLILAEDDYPTVVRPRLDKLGADVQRIVALKGIYSGDGEDFLLLDHDGFPALRTALEEVQPKLVIIDPVLAYVDGKLDAHRQNAVRSVTRPLAEMAREYGAVVLALRHLTKSDGGRAIYRGQTSIDWIAAARSALLVGFHPEDRSLPQDQRRRVLAHVKSNEAYGASLAFKIDHLGLTWLPGTVEVTADDLVAPVQQEKRESKLELAMDWLLENHRTEARPKNEVIEEGVAAGHTERTLYRAFGELQGKSEPVRVPGGRGIDHWEWLPLSGASSRPGRAGSGLHGQPLDGQTQIAGHLETDGGDAPYSGVLTPNRGGSNRPASLDGQTKILGHLEVGHLEVEGSDSVVLTDATVNGNGHQPAAAELVTVELVAEQDRLDLEELDRMHAEWAGFDR